MTQQQTPSPQWQLEPPGKNHEVPLKIFTRPAGAPDVQHTWTGFLSVDSKTGNITAEDLHLSEPLQTPQINPTLFPRVIPPCADTLRDTLDDLAQRCQRISDRLHQETLEQAARMESQAALKDQAIRAIALLTTDTPRTAPPNPKEEQQE